MKKTAARTLFIASLALIVGCWNVGVTNRGQRDTERGIAEEYERHQATPPAIAESARSPFIAGQEIKLSNQALPSFFAKTVTLVSSKRLTLPELAARISQIVSIPVDVEQTALRISMLGGSQVGYGMSGVVGQSAGLQGGMGAFPPPNGIYGAMASPFAGTGFGMSLDSPSPTPLRNLLDQIASYFGVYWKWDSTKGRIRFFYTETRTFEVTMLPGQGSVQDAVSNSGTIGGAGMNGSSGGASAGTAGGLTGASSSINGTSSQTVNVTTNIDPYADVTKSVWSILGCSSQSGAAAGGAAGGPVGNGLSPMGAIGGGMSGAGPCGYGFSVNASPSTHTITVTATPPVLDQVAEYVNELNDQFSKQVLITFQVYSVQLNHEQNYGLNLDEVLRFASRNFGLTGSSVPLPTPTLAAAGTITAAVIGGDSAAGQYVGSKAIVQALAAQGDVTLRENGSALVQNGQPAPMQVGNNITYLAESFTSASLGTVQGGLVPGQFSVGFSANFLPIVLDKKRVNLQFSIGLSQLQSLQTIESNGNAIQAPNIASQIFQQRAILHDGDTLLLSGFQQINDQKTLQGAFWPWLWAIMGGGGDWHHNRQVLVVSINVKLI